MAYRRQSLAIAPGSARRVSPQDTRGGWYDMSNVRFVGGIMQPIGGWKQLAGVTTSGAVRAILSWRDLARLRWVAAASLANIVVWDGSTGTDISPAGFVAGQLGGLLDGWGVGPYGYETWGTHRSLEPQQYRVAPGDTVTLDNYGQLLLAMGSADGRLCQWTPVLPVGASKLTPVSGAPSGRSFIVTDERSVVVIASTNDPRRVDWCSLENITDWTPTATNTAGSLQLKSSGSALAARRCAQGVLIFCDDDVHLLAYVGTPYVYGLNRVGSGCGPIGSEAMVAFSGRSVWMGQSSFWLWDGSVRPLPCDIAAYIFNDVSPTLQSITAGYHNGVFPEVSWQYCSRATAATTPDSYITWNYADNIWTHGRLPRSIGCEPGAYGLPLLGDAAGNVYQHETGWSADTAQRGSLVFAETGDLQLGDGDTLTFLEQLFPDLRLAGGSIQFHLKGQLEADGPETDFGVFPIVRTDGIIDACLETRSLRIRIEGVIDGPWQLGRMRIGISPGAGR